MTETSSYQDSIEKVLTLCGFRRVELGSSDFDVAFVRRGMFTSLVFLLTDLKEKGVDASSIKDLAKAGREWCANNVRARWFYNKAGLNLILIHRGQLPVDVLRSKSMLQVYMLPSCKALRLLMYPMVQCLKNEHGLELAK